jgi:TonB family protein
MTTPDIYIEPNLPWVEGKEDRVFKRMVILFIILFLIGGMILNSMTLPEIQKKKLVDVSPRLAQLILEKKKEPPPPPPKKKEKPKPEKKKEVKKPEPKKQQPKPKPKPDSRTAARKKAEQSGLIALSDDLADLRESFDFSDITDLPQQKTGKKAKTAVSTSDLLTAKAAKGSGGIKTNTLTRQIKGSELAQRQTSAVKSKIESSEKIAAKAAPGSARSASRSQEEIERVFQKNKGAIFSIYNRELRKDPSLQGKVVVELTIAPNGAVTKCVIVSSELGHKKLEKRLISKIKKFRFASKEVPTITVNYPIDFLPS